MAKRFYNTLRIEEDWYLELSCKHRELLRYCESKCDGAGIFYFNSKIATNYIGEKVTENDLENLPIKKLNNGKYILIGYCFFQNGKLSENSPAHNPIFKSLEENGISLDTLYNTLSDRVYNTLLLKEKERVIEKEEEVIKEKEKESEPKIIKSELEITFDKFLDMRKAIKKPATERAIELIKTELKKLCNNNTDLAIAILNQSIVNSWQDVYPIKNKNQNNGTQRPQRTNPFITEIRE